MVEFWNDYGWPLFLILAQSVALIVILLVIIAFLLYADRKVWAAVQMRRGPNVVGPFGLWQSFADLFKFVFKEPVIPAGSNKILFLLAPLVTAGLALSAWAVIPVAENWAIADLNVGILFVFAVASLEVYGVVIAGWASNSKYAFLSALRSAAQMVSYEVSIGFVIVTVLLCAGSLNLSEIVLAQDTGILAVIALLRALLAGGIDFAAVVLPPLLGIVQDGVGRRGFLELRLSRVVARIEIRVILLGELPVGLAYLIGARGLGHAEHGIEVVCHLRLGFRFYALSWIGIRHHDPGCHNDLGKYRGLRKVRGRAPDEIGALDRRLLHRDPGADLAVTLQKRGELLEAPLHPLPLQIAVGLRQGPDQPVALIAERRVGEHPRQRRRHHIG
jgi:hypothetical protein